MSLVLQVQAGSREKKKKTEENALKKRTFLSTTCKKLYKAFPNYIFFYMQKQYLDSQVWSLFISLKINPIAVEHPQSFMSHHPKNHYIWDLPFGIQDNQNITWLPSVQAYILIASNFQRLWSSLLKPKLRT